MLEKHIDYDHDGVEIMLVRILANLREEDQVFRDPFSVFTLHRATFIFLCIKGLPSTGRDPAHYDVLGLPRFTSFLIFPQ